MPQRVRINAASSRAFCSTLRFTPSSMARTRVSRPAVSANPRHPRALSGLDKGFNTNPNGPSPQLHDTYPKPCHDADSGTLDPWGNGAHFSAHPIAFSMVSLRPSFRDAWASAVWRWTQVRAEVTYTRSEVGRVLVCPEMNLGSNHEILAESERCPKEQHMAS